MEGVLNQTQHSFVVDDELLHLQERETAFQARVNRTQLDYSLPIVEERSLKRSYNCKPLAFSASNPEIRQKILDILSVEQTQAGETLRKLREIVGIPQAELQQHTKISTTFIEKLETNSFEGLPEAVYVKGFLKSYLRYLGVNDNETLINCYLARYKDWLSTQKKA